MYKKYIKELINNQKIYKRDKERDKEIGVEIYKLGGKDGLLTVINILIDKLNESGYSCINIEYIHHLENCWNIKYI